MGNMGPRSYFCFFFWVRGNYEIILSSLEVVILRFICCRYLFWIWVLDLEEACTSHCFFCCIGGKGISTTNRCRCPKQISKVILCNYHGFL